MKIKFLELQNRGEVFSSTGETNSISNNSGLFSAIEANTSFLIAVNDMNNVIRTIDFKNLKTVSQIPIFGLPTGLSCFKNDETFVILEDLAISWFDLRADQSSIHSNILSSPPTTISTFENLVCTANEDRKIRIFETRKFESPIVTSKPATKYGIVALHIANSQNVFCVGEDESLALVNVEEKVGQFKRKKFLSESPFISSPFVINDKVNFFTQQGFLHSFTNILEFFNNLNE